MIEEACVWGCVRAYLNTKAPRNSTESEKLNTWRTKPKSNKMLRIYSPILLHHKSSKHNRAKESMDTTHCMYFKPGTYETKFLCSLSLGFRRQSPMWEQWKSSLRTIKQMEVPEPMHWLFHACCWQTFKTQLSSKPVKSWRISAVSFSFMILPVHSLPRMEN